MSEVKKLLDSLLLDIYGKQQVSRQRMSTHRISNHHISSSITTVLNYGQNPAYLQTLNIRKLIDICAILKMEIRLMGYLLERVLISRDRRRQHQEVLCAFINAILHVEYHDAHPRMRFSLTPPPLKASSSIVISPTKKNMLQTTNKSNEQHLSGASSKSDDDSTSPTCMLANDDAASDYNQWLHAMKLVARLPGGMPPEFRRKLWLSLADKYLKSKNIDWSKEEDKCFCEKWREDDEELGIQIVKDLHRTGSNLCTGPAGSINQAKLKRILLGYARYNPGVGYCQGFNMLGALILQVMDKEESESMKVMIYLVEGILPPGYFCGSMGGLQADMGVFRELMQTRLPRLAKHLQKLQGPMENAYEPPLTNVFTMQWFLTMFCTCLPMSCVLRVWDLVLIEGSDVLLRTALVLWGLLEERVLNARTADDFYCKMGSFSSELLNGHLIDSNGLIEKVVQLGPIQDLQKLRDKHLYNIAPLRHKQGGLPFYFDDEDPESDEESRLAVATVWGLPWGRRGSHGQSSNAKQQPATENKDRIALDISLLKKQYDRLRERQKQAHIILTTACSTAARQSSTNNPGNSMHQSVSVNQLLMGRSAIVTNKGRRVGPLPGAIPPARKPSLPAVLQAKPPEKQLRRGETLHWRDADIGKRRRDSMSWKEIKAERAALLREGTIDKVSSQKIRKARVGKSDSSSYSEESNDDDDNDDGGGDADNAKDNDDDGDAVGGDGSSTDTSLCDEEGNTTGDKTQAPSVENSPKHKSKLARKQKDTSVRVPNKIELRDTSKERRRPNSWAPSSTEIPFTLMTSDSPAHSGDERIERRHDEFIKEEEDSTTECDRVGYKRVKELQWPDTKSSPIAGDLATTKLGLLHIQTDNLTQFPAITSTSQLSPMPDISTYLNNTTISPLPTPKPLFLESTNSLGSGDDDGDGGAKKFDVNEDGVTNQYFERVNSVERPTKLDLFYSLNEEDSIRNAYVDDVSKTGLDDLKANTTESERKYAATSEADRTGIVMGSEVILDEGSEVDADSSDNHSRRRMELLIDYSEKSSAAYIAEATSELSTALKKGGSGSNALDFRDGLEKGKETLLVRDDNIPGENLDDFMESKHIRVINNVNNFSKSATLGRKLSLNNAHKKRRDPRRLTLARSTTIDVEDHFEALVAKDPIGKRDILSATERIIPSTEALEERYQTLERQISCEKAAHKKLAEKDVPKHVPQNDESIKKGPISDTKDKRSPNREHVIPSTASLESRFNALEKQMSSTSSPAKDPVDLKNSDKDDRKETDTNKHTSKDSHSDNVKEESKTGARTKADDVPLENQNTEDKTPQLKKLPSTAELEDRFSALERKMSFQASSPSKSKKEPPDDKEEQAESTTHVVDEIKDKKVNQSEDIDKRNTSPKGNGENMPKIEQSQAGKREPSEKMERHNSVNNDKTTDSDKTAEHLKPKTSSTQKKSPPSTEELEKRFQALEKQLSSANLDITPEEKPSEGLQSDKSKTCSDKKQTSSKDKDSTSEEKSPRKATSKEIAKSSSSTENPPNKSFKSFEAKCKGINEKLSDEAKKTVISPANEINCDLKDDKCKTITKELETKERDGNEDPTQEPTKEECDITKRRASEPPSTEDLEKRYESLKRRMSTTKNVGRNLTRTETVEEAMTRIEKEVIEEISESNEKREIVDRGEEAKKIDDKSKQITEPPSTEDLESRFEALQLESSGVKSDALPAGETSQSQKTTDRKEVSASSDNKPVPEAPPMPTTNLSQNSNEKTTSIIDKSRQSNQNRALIEELQSKLKTSPNDENLKPSAINPNRKTPPVVRRTAPKVDETSETHANTASYRSGNYEPWQTPSNKMVRRFSDLPSRADLENRLQFLERQLFKKFYKQRCASDSEVASRKKYIGERDDMELPSTSSAKRTDSDLEIRVQALEKQLSENSLKLLEAMRARAEESAAPDDRKTPRQLSSETIDATGKELVRYTHYGELDDSESHKPINISINIKMMLGKDDEKKTKPEKKLPTTEELDKRLELLERQLTETKTPTSADGEKVEPHSEKEHTEEKLISVQKVRKDIANEEIKIEHKEPDSKAQESPVKTEVSKPQNEENMRIEKSNDNQQNINLQNTEKEHIPKELKVQQEVDQQEEEEYDNGQIGQISEKEKITIEESNVSEHTEKTDDESKELVSAGDQQVQKTEEEIEKEQQKSDDTINKDENKEINVPKELSQNLVINASDIGPAKESNKTLVLLLDNEPKAVKVRRLTRANTEELENLFQALEKQLSDRNLVKSEDGKLKHSDEKQQTEKEPTAEQCAISNLTKEIEQFTSTEKGLEKEKQEPKNEPPKEQEYDWGPDPVKRHLKRKTVHLPSTKELEARFRSLERQIKLLEDVEKIDVEQRLNEIERKIKLQYSLSHEKDLSKFLELCEGKGLDDEPESTTVDQSKQHNEHAEARSSKKPMTSPYTSPSRTKAKTPHTSPSRTQEKHRSPHTSPSPQRKRSPYTSPARQPIEGDGIPSTEDLEYRYRALDLKRSKSKENLKKAKDAKKQPIHPLEMLLDPSPDDSDIPTTGELEHRMRILEDKQNRTPSPSVKSRSHSPANDATPTKRALPTAEELEARVQALEDEKGFDFKMQKNFKEFKQKLKDVVSPSLSFEEFKAAKSREQSPKRSSDTQRRATTPRSALRDTEPDSRREECRSTSPKVIRFRSDEDYDYHAYDEERRQKPRTPIQDSGRTVGKALRIIEENSTMIHHFLKKTLADSNARRSTYGATSEGLDAMGTRLMRETSPLQRTGTHTGVPLRTNDNINERLTSIKNSIKSIDTLCEEKPYRKEKCQRYIDSLFSDSVHFASKKASLEDLSRSESRGRREYAPHIHVSDLSKRPSEYYANRAMMASAESIRSTSPLRAASPLHHRSNRDLRREISPRRRRDEEQLEEYESRVRRENLLPNYFPIIHSELSCSSDSLIKFHKVDRQLDTYKYDARDRSSSRSASRSPLRMRSPYDHDDDDDDDDSRQIMKTLHNNSINNNSYTGNTLLTPLQRPTTTTTTITINNKRMDLDRPVSPYRQSSQTIMYGGPDSIKRSQTPIYTPAKLEIRHTTVTSTFYDRLLTEKHIEKTLSRPPSRSPVVSPSVTSKSYVDLPNASANINCKSNPHTIDPLPAADSSCGSNGTTIGTTYGTYGGIGRDYTRMPPNYLSSGAHNNTITSATTIASNSITSSLRSITTTTMPNSFPTTTLGGTGKLNAYQNASQFAQLPPPPPLLVNDTSFTDMRIRSCDNILMQLKSICTTTASAVGPPSVLATISTTPSGTPLPYHHHTPYTYSSSSACATTTTSTSNPSSTTISTFLSTSTASTNLAAINMNHSAVTYPRFTTTSNLINTSISHSLLAASITSASNTTTPLYNIGFYNTMTVTSTTTTPTPSISRIITTTALDATTLRQPSDIGHTLGLYTSTLNNNFNSRASTLTSSLSNLITKLPTN